ncbi:hypothetical protein M5K25_002300 [Dendrobium thyrsiflorum]|uniref:Uncharacterized protein n=1 Tax=Dendrobium thyrsiflorum TaxID=117978 RepID=A0ABD0VSL2_DENTH
MEESTESSIKRDLNFSINSSSSSSSLESGWTVYFEEFLASQKEEQKEQKTSSMVSDAASNFPGKVTVKSEPEPSVSCKRISLKKRKAKGVSFFDDDPLQDTASSPANSPTVSGMGDYLDVNKGKKDDIRSIEGHEKVKDCENCEELKREVFDGLGIADGSKELTELKKKGLCLVPLSMLVDFLEQ